MEGRRNPTGSVSPLHDRTSKGSISPLHCQAPKGSVSPLNSRSTPKRSVSPFNNRTPTSSVSSLNHHIHTPKRSPSPLPNQTPKGSISPLHSRAPKSSVSPVHNQTSKRSVSPFLGQRAKGSVSPFLGQRAKGSVSPLDSQTTTSSVSPLKTQIPKRWPSPLLSQTSLDSGSSLHNITPKRSASPLLGKNPKESVSSLYSRTPKGSVSPLHDKTSKRSVSPLLSQTSKGSISPLHSQTPKRSVSPFQHKTPNRSVSPFQHQTPKGSVSPIHGQIPKRSVSPHLHQAPTLSDSHPLQVQEEIPGSLVIPLHDEGQTHEGSVSPLHDEQKTQEGMVSPLHNEEKTHDSTVSPLHDEEKTLEGVLSPLHDEGSVSLTHTEAKPSPNYLKASSGTCHDLCKYGARHNLEEERGKHGGPKSFKKGQNNGERRKKTIIKLRSLSSGRIVFSEKIEIRIEDSLCSNEEGNDPVEWQDIKSYDDASIPSTEVQNEAEPTDSISDEDPDLVERRNKKQVLKSKESNGREAPEKKERSSKMKTDTNKKPDRMKENTSLQERKAITPAKPKLKEESDEHFRKPGKSKVIGRPTVENVAANEPVATKKKTSIFTILRSGSGQRSHEGKSEKGVNRQKKGTNMASTSSHSETKEKVLHIIEPKPPKTTSKIRGSKFTEEQDTIKPEKSTFRRGKVVELPPDPGTPKKIKFRKGRRSSENLGGFQLGRRSFRRKGSISAGSSNPHGQVVVLRHRESEEKKGIQGLFNSIIEETVNKLVKTRKSKVKALVGAFETVISLQDGKSVSVE